jgi:hypothetical protein
MKHLMIAASAAAAVLALSAAAPALADPASGVQGYGTLGYSDFNTGRLGARFGPNFGVEGELSGGIGNDHATVGGTSYSAHLNDQYAVYGVGFVPLSPNIDLFGRIGVGQARVNGPAYSTGDQTSWNIGAGGQYFFDNHNGVRAEYTRMTFDHADIDANVWSLSYVRKF